MNIYDIMFLEGLENSSVIPLKRLHSVNEP
jgi:hypothetical protein